MKLENVEDIYPLSPLQEGLLFHSLSEQKSHVYFNQMIATLHGNLDEPAFTGAWKRVIQQHPILRTFFVWQDVKAPVQVVEQRVTLPFEKQDWRGQTPAEQQQRLENAQHADLDKGFDLAYAPLMRLFLYQTKEDSHEFLWSFHHILLDGWSMFHLLKEVFELYSAISQGQELRLQPRRSYRDYISWLKQQDLSRAQGFWRNRLQGFTAPTPLFENRNSEKSSATQEEFDTRQLRFSKEKTAALQMFCRDKHITLSTLIQGAWALLLSRYCGEDDVVFGTVVSGRPAALPGVELMVGLFINTLPVRVQISPDDSVLSWLKKLQTEQVELLDYEYSPLAEVQRWSDLPGGVSLFDSILMFENYHKDTPLEEMGESLKIGNIRWFERVNYPLVALVEPGEELQFRIVYHRQRFDSATIIHMLEHWQTLLKNMVAVPNGRLANLSLITETERQKLLIEWNNTRTEYPRTNSIHALFEARVAETPDAVALVFADKQLTYGELNARANQVAHFLRRQGVGPEVKVGLGVERSLEMVIGLLGILKAGGVYVPLDPQYPSELLTFMLQDTKTPVLLTQEKLAAKLPEHQAQVVRLDSDWPEIANESLENPVARIDAENLAYVMYTSGSTGLPKGTCVPHRAVVRLVKESNYTNFSTDEVFLQFAPISFDASTFEIWGSLLNGAKLMIYPAHIPSLEELGQFIQQEKITTLWLTAGLFHEMMEKNPAGLQSLRQLLAGGDVLSVSYVKSAAKLLQNGQIINGYGPTENTTFTCCYPVTNVDEFDSSVPLGRPISNTRVFILDNVMQPVPVGVVGELYIAGDGLARDYLNRPELTAERFIPDPFSNSPGARLYFSGDRARYREDGNIEFLGRNDFQIKMRGYRIELGEIETNLTQHPAVQDAMVVVREDEPGDKRLVAYFISDRETVPAADELREFLKYQLPDYMIPSAFLRLDSFPLTANGKVNREILPAPEGNRPELVTDYVAPSSETEMKIAAIWQQVLKLDRVGLYDNFFDLGGHSLHLMQVHNKLKSSFSKELSMVAMFKYSTVGSLANYLTEDQNGSPALQQSQDRADLRKAARKRRRQRTPVDN